MRDKISKFLLSKSERLYMGLIPGGGSGGDTGEGGDTGGGGGSLLIGIQPKISLPSTDNNKVTISQYNALDKDWYIEFDTTISNSGNNPNWQNDSHPNGPNLTYFYYIDKLYFKIYEVPTNSTLDKNTALLLRNTNITTKPNLLVDFSVEQDKSTETKTNKFTKYLDIYPTGKKVLDYSASYLTGQDFLAQILKSNVNSDPNYIAQDPNNVNIIFSAPGIYVEETFDTTKKNADTFKEWYTQTNDPSFLTYTDSNNKTFYEIFPLGRTFETNKTYLIYVIASGSYDSTNIFGVSPQQINKTDTNSLDSTASYQYFSTPTTNVSNITPVVINVKSTNSNLGGQNNVNTILEGRFTYNFSSTPYRIPDNNRPIEWGFYFKKDELTNPSNGTQNWLINSNAIANTSNNFTTDTLLSDDSSYPRDAKLTYSGISGLLNNTKYYYLTYVKMYNGTVVYSTISNFTTPPAIIANYINPSEGVTWYQMYKNWELIDTNSPNSLVPFYRIVRSGTETNRLYPLFYYFNSDFYKDKNYQFRVITENLRYPISCSFSISTPWGEKFKFEEPYYTTPLSNPNYKINLYLYTNINSSSNTIDIKSISSSNITPKNPITFIANDNFGSNNEGLVHVSVNENAWTIQGYAPFNFLSENKISPNEPTNGPISNSTSLSDTNLKFDGTEEIVNEYAGKGWHFIEKTGTYIWMDKWNNGDVIENSKNLPIGGDPNNFFSNKSADSKWRKNNFIAKKITNQTFNIQFDYEIERSDIGISIYLSGVLPTTNSNGEVDYKDSVKIYGLTGGSGKKESFEFIGLQGNQYIIFVGDTVGTPTSTTYSICKISNLKTAGGYYDGNNINYETKTNYVTKTNLVGVTYSTSLGQGNSFDKSSVITTKSKSGNGRFLSGIWENGVWNSGWREDKSVYEFYNVNQFSSYNRDKKWKLEIVGPKSSVTNLNIGDKVSISNIVAIDINEERKILNRYYTILEKSDNGSITVEFESDFPLRRIEKDSDYHRILITKNIWLSGVFLNGYFKGIWNNGLFSGFPLVTKMDNSHWITGIFNGGHFTSNKYKTEFYNSNMVTYENAKRVGLKFNSKHKLNTGDIITLTTKKYTTTTTTVVLSVSNENELITGIAWNQIYLNNSGKIETVIGTGLVQNFDFYSNNVSDVTSLTSMDNKRIFSYNSWIDVNYSDKSAVNIGKPQSLTDEISGVKYSENNLYGYPTLDILSSNSTFRDSFSNNSRKYKLGTKYKIFDDFVGDSSKFEDAFDSTNTQTGLDSFNSLGWQVSKETTSSLTFSRTPESLDETSITKGNELMVYSKGKGGNLNLTKSYDILNRSNSEIEKLRYSLIEFDLKYKTNSLKLTYTDTDLGEQPPIHFNNLNYVLRNTNINGLTQSKNINATYLPIYKNVNHLLTNDIKKQEFFFNRRNLLMNFRGLSNMGENEIEYYLDNIKFYQIDMVPFFQYFTTDNINKSVQIPNQILAPTIDWVDENQQTDIVSNIVDNLVIENIEVPSNINWKSDYVTTRSESSTSTTTTTTIFFNPSPLPEWINPNNGTIDQIDGFG